jgi:hypothetical protein
MSREYRHLPLGDVSPLHPTLADLLTYVDDCAAQADAFLDAVRMTAQAHPDSAPLRMLAHLAEGVEMLQGAGAGGIVDHAYELQRELETGGAR